MDKMDIMDGMDIMGPLTNAPRFSTTFPTFRLPGFQAFPGHGHGLNGVAYRYNRARVL